jgi:hypothetical protein
MRFVGARNAMQRATGARMATCLGLLVAVLLIAARQPKRVIELASSDLVYPAER